MWLTEFRDRLHSITFSSRLYRNFLTGPLPRGLAFVPVDPWPGDGRLGQLLVQGPMGFGPGEAPDLLHSAADQASWRQGAHDFEWLRDLRAVGGDAGRRRARALVRDWLAHFGQWHVEAWDPAITGLRISNCIALHDFYCASADSEFREQLFISLVQQIRHLNHITGPRLDPLSQFCAVKGMLIGALAFSNGFEAIAERGLLLFRHLLPQLAHSDGGNRWRNPQLQTQLVRHLVDIRGALRQGGQYAASPALAAQLEGQIGKLSSVIRFFRHGDGGHAVFNGGNEDRAALIDAVLAHADSRARPKPSLGASGYERLMGGRSLAIVDCGIAPRQGFDRIAHAAPGAFEFSHGRERIFVNCGAPEILPALQNGSDDMRAEARPAVAHWRQALASTAAHNCLVIADRNAAEILPSGVGQGVQLSVSRMLEDGGERLEISHDGWQHSHGARWKRVLWLSESGREFCGEESIDAKMPQSFAVRFHLHPQLQAVPIKKGMGVLLRLPSGAGWRFLSERHAIKVQPSIYCAAGHPYRRTRQLVIEGMAGKGQTRISWVLAREEKANPE